MCELIPDALCLLLIVGFDYDAIRCEYPTESFVKVFTFNSARKSMSTVVPLPGGGYRLFTKGASEIVLGKCTAILAENGRIAPLTPVDKKEILSNVVQSMASNALRTIGLAYRYVACSSEAPYLLHFSLSTTFDMHVCIYFNAWQIFMFL